MTEKLHLNFVVKYDQYSNLKGIILVRWKKAFGFSRGHKRAQSKILLMHVSSKR